MPRVLPRRLSRRVSRRVALPLAGVLALLLSIGGLAGNAGAVATSTTTDPVQAGAGWLATQFEDATHLPAPAGDHFDSNFGGSFYPSYGANADVIFGLAAAGAGKTKITTALGYLASNLDAYADVSGTAGGPYDGSVAKVALAAQVAGVSGSPATAFAGHDLLAQLKSDQCTAATPVDSYGSYVCVAIGAATNIYSSVSESLTLLAEARGGGVYVPDSAAISYFDTLQCPSGGFTGDITACSPGDEDLDATSYAIMALSLLGAGQSAHLTAAVNWLHGQQNAGGYWVSQGGANTNSTGLAVAALAPQSINVASARTWLLSQQVAAGSTGAGAFQYAGAFAPTDTSATSPSVLATAQALTGLVSGGSLATVSAATASAGTAAFAPTQTLSAPTAVQGSTQTVTANGFAAGESVEAIIHSAPVSVGTAIASAGGSVTISYVVPAGVDPGAHTLVLTGATSGLSVTSALAVTAAAAVLVPVTTPTITTAADELANTGQNRAALLELSIVGALALLLGSGLVFGSVLGARRRRV
jgi:hypothetical protein